MGYFVSGNLERLHILKPNSVQAIPTYVSGEKWALKGAYTIVPNSVYDVAVVASGFLI